MILSCINILILITSFLLEYYNMNYLQNLDDKFSNLIGFICSAWMLPYTVIAIIVGILIMFLYLVNKKIVNIISLILEIIYFVFVNVTCLPFAFFNFNNFNYLLAYLIYIIYEILSIYLIVLMIRKIRKK